MANFYDLVNRDASTVRPHRYKDNYFILLGEVGAILIGFWYVCFYTDYTFLNELFELRPFMQTVIPHGNHLDGFLLTHTQSPIIIHFDVIFFPFQNTPDIQGYSDTPFYFILKR